jgi:hypothetical protein
MYALVQDRVQAIQNKQGPSNGQMGVLKLEETIRMWKEVRKAGKGDPTIEQKLSIL